jgi:hypothetical protein
LKEKRPLASVKVEVLKGLVAPNSVTDASPSGLMRPDSS